MKRTFAHLGAAALLLATCAGALAVPAPFYQWRSSEDSTVVCTQISPGDGWIMVRGPFQDARCKKPGKVTNQI